MFPTVTGFFISVRTGPRAQPASYTTDSGSFLGVKWTGRGVSTHPLLAPKLEKEYSNNIFLCVIHSLVVHHVKTDTRAAASHN